MGYSLSLERVAAPSPTAIPINFGETITGDIDPFGEMDLFVMNGSAGDVVVVQAASNSSYPCIEVFDPAGVQIASRCSFRSARVDVTLASSGQHTLLVTYQFNDRTMGYSLSLERVAAPSPTAIPINFGETITGDIDPFGEMDLFVMNGSAGDVVVVQAASNSSYPCIEVFDPAGVQIASQCSFRSARVDVTLASSGQHTLLVTYQFNDRTMGYSLSLERVAAPSPTAIPINFGETITGDIDPFGEMDLFVMNGSAGDVAVVQAASNSSYPCIEVFDPAGVQIASQCSFRSARVDVTLASSGQHTLLVTYQFNDRTMGYSLSLERVAAPSPTAIPINFGETITGDIDPFGEMDLFVMNGSAGDVAVVQAASNSSYPCIEVFDPAGVQIASQCSFRSARVDVTLASSGQHTLLVTYQFNDRTMGYSLTTQCFGACPLIGDPGAQQQLMVAPNGLFFNFVQGSNAEVRIVTVSNDGADQLDFTASVSTITGGSWLAVSPTTGTLSPSARGSLAVVASPSGIPSGTYSGRVTVSSPTTNETVVVPVTMSISGSAESIILSQTGLTFRSVFGGGTVPPQNFRVLNSGAQPLFWTAMTTTLSGGEGWLAISPTSGFTDPADPRPAVEVRVTPGDLEPGEYYGRVEVSATGVDNSPQSLSVVLNILPAGSDPGPVVDPLGLIFVGEPGGENPPAQTVLVSNLTRDPLTFTATAVFEGLPEWFSHQPTMATVLTGESVPVEIQPDLAGLGAGVFRARLELQFAESGRMREVELLLVVSPGAGAEVSAPQPPLLGSPKQDLCIPSKLLLAFTRLGTNFTVTAGWPTRIEVESVDECGSPMDKGAVQVSFSNGDVPLSLTSLRDGRWASTWVSRDTSLSEVTVTAQAVLLNPPIEGTAEITVGLQADATPPVIGAGAVVSAASFEPQVPLAPGSLISIFGERLSGATDASKALPLSTDLSGTSVTIAGRPMPLLFVSEGQINAMIPFTVPANTRHQVLVRRGSTVTVPEPVTLADAHPGVFSEDQTGEGQGVIVTADGRLVEPGNPVKPGDAIVIFAAGLGEVDPPLQAGEATPLSPLSWTTSPATVTVGGLEADVFFAGATAEFTGLYQVNAFVPEGVTPGSAVEVVVTVAGQSIPPVTIAIE